MLLYQKEKLKNVLAKLCGLSTVPHSGLNDFITQSKGYHNFSGFLVRVNKVKEKKILLIFMTKQALEEAIRKLLQQLKNAHKNINNRNHLF